MSGFAAISAVRINMSQLTPQKGEQGGQHLCIMDIFQRDFRRHDIMGHRVYRQMRLASDPPLLSAVFSALPLAFTKHLQTRRVDNQVGDAPLAGLPIGCGTVCWHSYSQVCTTAHSSTRAGSRVVPGWPQSEVENPLEHQGSTDGLVSVKQAAAPPPMMVVVKPVVHGLGINPGGE